MRTRLILTLAATLALLGGATLVPADEPPKPAIPPRTVKLDKSNSTLSEVIGLMNKQTGIPVAFPPAAAKEPCDGIFNRKPFWEALEFVADQTGHRIALHDGGRKVALEPRGKSREVSAVSGAFRVVARQTVGRFLLDQGVSFHEVHLDVHWEPRFPVFRIDSQPKVTKVTDDRGTALTVPPESARTQPTGAVHGTSVRLLGLTRESRRIGVLAGHFTVAAAPKMLAFTFDNLTAKPPVALPPQENVSAVLTRFAKDETTWEAELELTYPPGMPAFESFESWTTENRLRLVSPDPAKAFDPDNRSVDAVGRKVTAVYRFKEDPAKGLANPTGKGWSLVYDAPAPLVEFRVPFELKDIPLP